MRALGRDLAEHLAARGANADLRGAIDVARSADHDAGVTNDTVAAWARQQAALVRGRIRAADPAEPLPPNERSAMTADAAYAQLVVLEREDVRKLTELYWRRCPVVGLSMFGALVYGDTHKHHVDAGLMHRDLRRYIGAIEVTNVYLRQFAQVAAASVAYRPHEPGAIRRVSHESLDRYVADSSVCTLPDVIPVAIHYHTARLIGRMRERSADAQAYLAHMVTCGVVADDHARRGRLFAKFTERVTTRASAFLLVLLLRAAHYIKSANERYATLRRLTAPDDEDELKRDWGRLSADDADCVEACVGVLTMMKLRCIDQREGATQDALRTIDEIETMIEPIRVQLTSLIPTNDAGPAGAPGPPLPDDD
jgi:hypothetical protein